MITEDNIAKVVELFKARQVNLYHACQLQDFEAYLNLGGIPSRKRLEISKKEFTAFATDEMDRENGVWDKVFVNLSDFGTTFANGGGGTPNPYGPILLTIYPSALKEAEDIAITLRSAGAADFNREQESLSCCEEVDRLFARPVEEGYPASSFIKFKGELQTEFNFPLAKSPEINCSYARGVIPMNYVSQIMVDPYCFSNQRLLDLVMSLTHLCNFQIRTRIRKCKCIERILVYKEIAEASASKIPTLEELATLENGSQELKRWVAQMQVNSLEWQLNRFAGYLREGTILPALSMINS